MTQNPKRILIIDDNIEIHKDFRKILEHSKEEHQFAQAKSKVFATPVENIPFYIIDSAYQGQEALHLVQKAVNILQPYALAFVDIRMPPGWDGVETIKEIWKVDPNIQLVICTAYSDYSWQEMFEELQNSDNFLILRKPFDPSEICQLAASLTKKWELKQRLIKHIESLETIVQQRTQELRRAKEISENANRLKSLFLANVSLELRTPLNNIIGFAELMHDKKIDENNCHEYINDILISANHLAHMINDMLDISKIDFGKIEFHPQITNVRKTIDEIKKIHKNLLEEKKIKFTVSVNPSVWEVVTDPIKLKQIFFHYIANAIKFSKENGKIEVRVFSEGENAFRIEVEDTGIGIKAEDIPGLFVTFQQLDLSMSKRYPGIGIGLALVRRIVEFQGGKVGVTSEVGKGSTFYAILPRTNI